MRQLKSVVIMVGVALSATPIFNSAIAQQSSTQASLMLEVQSLRQEIAQLRDMVERQQFEMRKLKRQQTEMQKALSAPANPAGSAPLGLDPSRQAPTGSYIPPSSDGAYNGIPSDSDRSGAYQQPSAYNGPSANQTYPATTNNASRRVSSNGTVIEERTITAGPPGSETGQQSGSVPVVDRSFSQQTRDVPVTGNGAFQQNGSVSRRQGDFEQNRTQQVNNTVSRGEERLSATGLDANEAAARQAANSNTGVVAIPQDAGNSWRTNTANQAAANTAAGAIVANTIPVNPNAAATSNPNQVDAARSIIAPTDSSADGAPTLSEDDYYGQGFELLKQSKYEEAATIFERQIKAYPRGNLADDAHYWIAEAMHVSRKLDVSKQHLKIIINDYPQSPRLPDAMLKTAYIEQSEGNKIEAQILFQEIVSLHPKSDAAIAAKNQLVSSN